MSLLPRDRPVFRSLDPHHRERWLPAVEQVAQRLNRERGLDEAWSVTDEYGALWANYGPVRISLAGAGQEVDTPEDLFESLDWWVAFERSGGPGRRLHRDQQRIDEWRAQLTPAMELWQRAAAPVFADLARTTRLRLEWSVTVHEEEPAGFGYPDDARQGLWLSSGPRVEAMRPLLLPELWLETDGWGQQVNVWEDDEDDAVIEVAVHVQELAIDELHTEWPRCPLKAHPLDRDMRGGARSWTCETHAEVSIGIGRLGLQSDH